MMTAPADKPESNPPMMLSDLFDRIEDVDQLIRGLNEFGIATPFELRDRRNLLMFSACEALRKNRDDSELRIIVHAGKAVIADYSRLIPEIRFVPIVNSYAIKV